MTSASQISLRVTDTLRVKRIQPHKSSDPLTLIGDVKLEGSLILTGNIVGGSQVDINAVNTNTININTNHNSIQVNAQNIQLNTNSVNTNTTSINTNLNSIQANAQNIQTNTNLVNTNITSINTNLNSIQANAQNIQTNTNAIANLPTTGTDATNTLMSNNTKMLQSGISYFDIIQNQNDSFQFTSFEYAHPDPNNRWVTITVPPGVYNADELAKKITSVFNNGGTKPFIINGIADIIPLQVGIDQNNKFVISLAQGQIILNHFKIGNLLGLMRIYSDGYDGTQALQIVSKSFTMSSIKGFSKKLDANDVETCSFGNTATVHYNSDTITIMSNINDEFAYHLKSSTSSVVMPIRSFTIPAGTYTRLTLVSAINALLTAENVGSISYSTSTLTTTFNFIPYLNQVHLFTYAIISNDISQFLGLKPDVYGVNHVGSVVRPSKQLVMEPYTNISSPDNCFTEIGVSRASSRPILYSGIKQDLSTATSSDNSVSGFGLLHRVNPAPGRLALFARKEFLGYTLAFEIDQDGYCYHYYPFYNSSDDKLKHNEKEIKNGLNVINVLKIYEYDKTRVEDLHKYDPDHQGEVRTPSSKEIGVIAQDVEQIPELKQFVQPADYKNDIPMSVNYQSLYMYGLKAIQELSAVVQQQAAKISELQARMDTITSSTADM